MVRSLALMAFTALVLLAVPERVAAQAKPVLVAGAMLDDLTVDSGTFRTADLAGSGSFTVQGASVSNPLLFQARRSDSSAWTTDFPCLVQCINNMADAI